MVPSEAIAVTLDIDWAPDFVIDEVAEALAQAGVPATWFVTHASPAVDRLRGRPELFELGIHPNFLARSSHGSTVEAVMGHLLEIVPGATSMRTHGLVQSSVLLDEIATMSPISTDVSLLLPFASHLAPVRYRTRRADFVRLPYFWEDDLAMCQRNPCWTSASLLAAGSGLKIFDFHPIHIALNSPDMTAYEQLKRAAPDLVNARPTDVARNVHPGPGAGTFFAELLTAVAGLDNVACVRDIASRSKVAW